MLLEMTAVKKATTALALFGTVALTCATTAHAESTLETVLERGEFVAGVVVDAPPTGSMDAQGNIIGYGPDVARYLAARLGVDLSFVEVTGTSRVPLLLTNRIDAEVGKTSPGKVRNEVVDFTLTYMMDSGVMLVRTGESTNPEDYYNTDKVIGSIQGSGFVNGWKRHSPDATFSAFQSESDVAIALTKGNIDVHLVGEAAAQKFAESGELTVGGVFAESPNIIMVRQDDSQWRNWLNWALMRMHQEGTMQDLYKKWYGIDLNFEFGDAGKTPGDIMKIGTSNDPWNDLPDGFLDALLSDQSYKLK